MAEFEHNVYILGNVYEEKGARAAFVWLAGWLQLGLINKYQYEACAQEIRRMDCDYS